MSQLTSIDLLRHGKTQGANYYRGVTDEPLILEGWQQMRNAVTGQDWDIIISSPLCRCADFAKELSDERHIPIHFDKAFREFNFGDWEGKTADQISRCDPHALMKFYADPVACSPPSGDNMQDFHLRVIAGWRNLLDKYPGQRMLLITHAGVIRMFFAYALEIPLQRTFNIQVEYVSLTCFHYIHPDFLQLVSHQNIDATNHLLCSP